MADFSNQDIGAPQGSVAPQGPVVDQSQAVTLQGVGQGIATLFGGGQALMQNAALQKKEGDKKVADQVMSDYGRKVVGLNTAVEQGRMTWNDAKSRQRALYNQTLSQYPSLTGDITKFNGELASQQGLGDVLAKGTAVDQQIQTDTKSATAAGFINPDMTPQQQAAGLDQYRGQQHAINSMDFYSKQLGIQSQKASIAASQETAAYNRTARQNALLDISIKRNKQNVQNSLADVTTAQYGRIQTQLGQIQTAVDNKQMSQEDALRATAKLEADFQAQLMPVRGAAGADYVDGMTSPITKLIATQNDMLSGKISKDVAQNRVDNLTAQATLPLMQDPLTASVLAASKMAPNLTPALMAQYGQHVVTSIQKNMGVGTPANPVPDLPAEKEQNKTYLKSVGSVIDKLSAKDPSVDDPKGTMAEVQSHVNQILKGVNAFSMSVDNPAQLNDVTSFLASKSFLDYQKMGGQIAASNTDAVKSIVSEQYNNKVLEAIRSEWANNSTTVGYPQGGKQVGPVFIPTPNTQPTQQAVDYRWSGNGLTFVPAKGYERNAGAMSRARDLNAKTAPLINKLVRMSAHLDGSDDYTKYFKEDEEAIFGKVKDPTNGE